MDPEFADDEPNVGKSRWRVDKREVLHKNPWYEYRHDKGLTDHGKPFDYYYVYKHGSAGIVAVTADGQIILVRQYRYLINQTILQIPGGNAADLHAAEEVARHEFLQETGYQPGTLVHLVDLSYAVGYSVDQLSIFLAKDCRRVQEQALEDSELGLTVETYPITEVYAMIERGEFTEPATIAALAVARRHLL